MPVRRVPKYRCYKPKNLGLVVLDGRQIYLGPYGTPESLTEYHRRVQEHLATRSAAGAAPAVADPAVTVNEIILLFWDRHATHYRHADGTPTGERDNFRDALRPLRKLYGSTPARDFRPLKLKLVRKAMLDAGLARTTINQRVRRIVRVFKWAASEELVPAAVYQALRTVSGLSKGRSEARETEPIRPVPDEVMDAVLPHVARQVATMIQIQRWSGMRPGEVVLMRGCDLERIGDDLFYTPRKHKTEHHGRTRRIALGPRAQEVLTPWLRADPAEYLFQPREAMAEFRAEQRRRRTTRLYPSQAARPRKTDPKRTLGDHYSTRTYYHAIQYECKRAGVALWHPNRIRHATATRVRRDYGLDAARAVLGHSDINTSEIYAERDREQAARVMREIG
jgi:integrase